MHHWSEAFGVEPVRLVSLWLPGGREGRSYESFLTGIECKVCICRYMYVHIHDRVGK